jgi:hypothetical protein
MFVHGGKDLKTAVVCFKKLTKTQEGAFIGQAL